MRLLSSETLYTSQEKQKPIVSTAWNAWRVLPTVFLKTARLLLALSTRRPSPTP